MISNRAINERAINRRAINDYMERLHCMMKYGNFIELYNNLSYIQYFINMSLRSGHNKTVYWLVVE